MSDHQDISSLFPSLGQLCLDVISNEFLKIAETDNYKRNNLFYLDNDQKFRLRNPTIFLTSSIATKLIKRLGEMDLLETNLLKLFSKENAQIIHVDIQLYRINVDVLKIFREHRIADLQIELVDDGTLEQTNKIINCLNKETLDGLRTLKVSNCKNVSILVNAIMIRNTLNVNLTNLNISYSSLTQSYFRTICMHFRHLQCLNVSGTNIKDLTEILRLKDQLEYLSLNDMPYLYAPTAVYVLKQMDKLKTLNLTWYPTNAETAQFGHNNANIINLLIRERDVLPELEIFDISGCRLEIVPEVLLKFIQSHRRIRSLGLIIYKNYLDVAHFCREYQQYLQTMEIASLVDDDAILYALEFNSLHHKVIARILHGINRKYRADITAGDKLFVTIFYLLNSYKHNCWLNHSDYLKAAIMDYFLIYILQYRYHLNSFQRNYFNRMMNLFMDFVETYLGYSQRHFQQVVQCIATNQLMLLDFDIIRFIKIQLKFFDLSYELNSIACNLLIIYVAVDKLNVPLHEIKGSPRFIRQLTQLISKWLVLRKEDQDIQEINYLGIIEKIPFLFSHYLINRNKSLSNKETCEMVNSYLTGDIINDINSTFIHMERFLILVFVLSLGKNSYFNQKRVFMDDLTLQSWITDNLDGSDFPIGCITSLIVLFELNYLLSLGHIDGNVKRLVFIRLNRAMINWFAHGHYDEHHLFADYYLIYIEIWCKVGVDEPFQLWALKTLCYLYTNKSITKPAPSSLKATLLDLRRSSRRSRLIRLIDMNLRLLLHQQEDYPNI